MNEMIKVKRIKERDSLMEDGREWPDGPVVVEKTSYIRRRLSAGDIIEVVTKTTSINDVETKANPSAVKGEK